MSQALDKLMFTIGLIDKVSGPISKIQSAIGGFASKAQQSFMQIGVGTAGLYGAGMALQSLVQPANDFNNALNQVASLGVAQDSLDKLGMTALDLSVEFGQSATDIVGSAYAIQSSIAGLTGAELSAFTGAGAALAQATLADTNTITDYMGRMYSIFQNTADKMGRSDWINQMAGMTAQAVQMFSTEGAQMAAAFGNLGASATSMGASMAEQMAILGTLQGTMSGSESATKYRAFIAGIGKAQDHLGLSFTDAAGNMLGIVPILEKIQGKFGDTLSVAESGALAKAFGSQEAVQMIQLLMNNTSGLADSIDRLGSTTGIQKALDMAGKTVDPWAQFSSSIDAVRIGFGNTLLPVLNPVIQSLADGLKVVSGWTEKFPNLTRVIGYGALAILGIGAALASLNIVMGIATLVSSGFGIVMAVITSPVTLVVGAIALLVAGVIGLIAYWDELKAAFLATDFGKGVMMGIDMIINAFSTMQGIAGTVIDSVIDGLNLIPGIDIATTSPPDQVNAPQLNSLSHSRSDAVPAGGVGKSITNAISNSSNARTVQIGKIETNQPAQSIEQEFLLAGA